MRERPKHKHDRKWDRENLPRDMTREEYKQLNHYRRFASIGARCGFVKDNYRVSDDYLS